MTVNCQDKCHDLVVEDFVHGESRYLKNSRCTVCGVYLSKKHYGVYCPCCNTVTRKSPRYIRDKEVPRI